MVRMLKRLPGLLLIGLSLILLGCVTIPKVTSPSGVDISVSAMSISQLKRNYGIDVSGDLNPFIPRSGVLTRQRNDFVVLKIDIAANRKAEVSLDDAVARDASGTVVAKLYTWSQFQGMLKQEYTAGRDYQQVYNRAHNAYLYSLQTEISPGRTSELVVLVGKHPLPKSVEVLVQMTVASGQPRYFKFLATPISKNTGMF